ncbi:hypothetical protein [Butyrivibrio proteoclasticus]|uniref:hypothetical protein n=1 Tax=Butyrivibrio proteoclasticus TaxID=43305 RepID=UPI00047C97CF|nr:hypothetical protein [Butyrivibrio proteoclasticus]
MTLTDNEKSVLKGISFNSDSIETGALDDQDSAILTEMRAVGHYLKNKYPTHNFIISGCEPKTGTLRDYNEWYFSEEDGPSYIAIAIENSSLSESGVVTSSRTVIKDNYYGEIVRSKIQESVLELVKSAGFPVIDVRADFSEFLGMEYKDSITVTDVLTGVVPAGNDFKVFLDGSQLTRIIPDRSDKVLAKSLYSERITRLCDVLKAKDIVGDVYVVILKRADADPIRGRLYSENVSIDGRITA